MASARWTRAGGLPGPVPNQRGHPGRTLARPIELVPRSYGAFLRVRSPIYLAHTTLHVANPGRPIAGCSNDRRAFAVTVPVIILSPNITTWVTCATARCRSLGPAWMLRPGRIIHHQHRSPVTKRALLTETVHRCRHVPRESVGRHPVHSRGVRAGRSVRMLEDDLACRVRASVEASRRRPADRGLHAGVRDRRSVPVHQAHRYLEMQIRVLSARGGVSTRPDRRHHSTLTVNITILRSESASRCRGPFPESPGLRYHRDQIM